MLNTVSAGKRPHSLVLPQFEYDLPSLAPDPPQQESQSVSKGFAFSAFFESSKDDTNSALGNLTFLRPTSPQSMAPSHTAASYIGFSWGPRIDAFDVPAQRPSYPFQPTATPLAPSKILSTLALPPPLHHVATYSAPPQPHHSHLPQFATPIRPASAQALMHPPSTIRRTIGGTARKAGSVRAVGELEALRAMGDCIRASARKRINGSEGRPGGTWNPGGPSKHPLKLKLDFEDVGSSGGSGVDNVAKGPGLRIFVTERTTSRMGSYSNRTGRSRSGSYGSSGIATMGNLEGGQDSQQGGSGVW